MQESQDQAAVWDPFVRIGHWTLAAAFLIAYFTAEDLEGVHVAAGWWVGGYVVARTVWGFVGSRHARFADFVRGPRAVLDYLAGLLHRRPAHYLGHNPAGGAMILALLLSLAATVASGFMVQADSENEGPLAPWLGHAAAPAALPAAAAPAVSGEKDGEKESESAYEELHGFFANLTLFLVGLHLLGVVSGSLLHKENLVRAMITGRKPRLPPDAGADARLQPARKA